MALSRGRAERSGVSFFVFCCFHRMLVCAAFPGVPCPESVGLRGNLCIVVFLLLSQNAYVRRIYGWSMFGKCRCAQHFVDGRFLLFSQSACVRSISGWPMFATCRCAQHFVHSRFLLFSQECLCPQDFRVAHVRKVPVCTEFCAASPRVNVTQ